MLKPKITRADVKAYQVRTMEGTFAVHSVIQKRQIVFEVPSNIIEK